MRQVTAWVTSDGQVHLDRGRAARHAEERYGAVVTALAHEIARIDRYTDAASWVEKNLPRFTVLQELSADRVIVEEDD